MQIDIKGRNLAITDELREVCTRSFEKIRRQVSGLAVLEIELYTEPNPAIADKEVAEATLYLKGATLRATEATPRLTRSIHMISDELARQVERHFDKRRSRREARARAKQPPPGFGPGETSPPA